MQEVKIAQLCQRLLRAPTGPLIGLDVGTRYIGIAVSDSEYRIAHPHSVIDIKGGPAGYASNVLGTLVKTLSAPGLVIGYPLRITGFQGYQGPLVEQFVRELQQNQMLQDSCFVFWDERLTSRTVEGAISFLKLEPRRRKQIVDKMAALCILQSCLDNMAKNKDRHLLALQPVQTTQDCL
ncbi:uncharacterized protein LOC112346382 [Selaginella moellendorffii]|uniref:uncharacterized protein LOC112346382 n=1 Tax=Selaginella moellendorffii TaxID=88036 RepID=UPI000D1C533C|nr:uncharacterized protein LOC112346382 [Selaginella moellendorffii]|eukprot:XP_024531010.1 uncharacterized protein LOC112346382 [Selaginella moellendorffii]